jgi:ethanolamine utilization protein EutN
MNLGRVIGSLWATRKDTSLEGHRLLLVQPLSFVGEDSGAPFISLDTVDAGPGDVVLYVTSTEAALPFRPHLTATDATIVGIVDRIDHQARTWQRAQEG